MFLYSIAQIFSAIGALCIAISAFSSSKKKMLSWQMTDYCFTALANLLLAGYTGALTITVSIIRNSLIIKQRLTIPTLILLIGIQISLGCALNQLGIIGFLPIISSVSYSIVTTLTSQLQWLRWVIIENMLLWFVYDVTIQAYPAAITDIVITVTSLVAIYRGHRQVKHPSQHTDTKK